MARKKKSGLGMLILPVTMFTNYVTHYKPTPILGAKKRGRKKNKWL